MKIEVYDGDLSSLKNKDIECFLTNEFQKEIYYFFIRNNKLYYILSNSEIKYRNNKILFLENEIKENTSLANKLLNELKIEELNKVNNKIVHLINELNSLKNLNSVYIKEILNLILNEKE